MGFLGEIVSGIFGTANNAAQMAWQSDEAYKNRSFQSEEAQTARQWQEDMYNKYQSPSAMMQQYNDAGLNTALMYGQGASSPSMSTASSGPSGSMPSASGMVDIAASILNVVRAKAEIQALKEQTKADVELKASQADKNRQDVVESDSRIELNKANARLASGKYDETLQTISNLQAENARIVSETQLNQAHISREELNTGLDFYKFLLEQENKHYQNILLSSQARLADSCARLNSLNEQLVKAQTEESQERASWLTTQIQREQADIEYLLRTMESRIYEAAGHADYANGTGKKFRRELTQQYVGDGIRALGVAAGLYTGTAVAGKSASTIVTSSGPKIDFGTVYVPWQTLR